MATRTRDFHYDDYTVAWACALPLEMAAAAAMLDERHSVHNVVIACLPLGMYGTTSAATVASQMRNTFSSVRFGLMVGIGGGAPSQAVDIRLNDVVVSKPTGLFGGVVQFDMGKTVSQGQFVRTGSLNKPPPVLLTALSTLQANHLVAGSRIPDLLREMVIKYPLMREKITYIGKDQDRLFESSYKHETLEKTCNLCDIRKMVQRPARATPGPVIHYGLIASGNQIMKDSAMRDHWAQELGIICFEMEAAGLMDILPCLVIRGICDYADSHKNKQWQEYAAVTAAAYTKELLLIVAPTQVVDTPTYISSELMSYRPKYRFPDNGYQLYHLKTNEHFGSGKTTIGTSVVETAKYRLSGNRVPTAFFYCESDRPELLEADHIVASLIKQLCKFLLRTSQLLPEDVTTDIERLYGTKRVKPDFENLRDLFVRIFDRVPGTVYIIDGLDALSAKGVTEVLKLCRFLWVYLQLEILWDTCDTDAEIRKALGNLPRELEETYSRCLQRMNLQDCRALKVLKWVSFASRPLHIEELKEAIAIEIYDTEWDASKIPRANSVLTGCANLVIVDPFDNCARFAHSSVKQYFQAESNSIPEYPKTSEQGELECGELCVNYLCFKDFSLQITKQSKEVAISLPNPVSVVRQSLSSSIGKLLPRSWRNQTGFAFRQVRNLRATQPDHSRYAFLSYAVMNWGLQTKAITRASPVWEAFEQLALRFSDTWNFHPWVPSGRSARAYLHGLFGWAVRERHLPLLSIVLSAYDDLETICNLPLVEERIPALHVASKSGYHDIVEVLLQYCDVNLQDVDGYLALHHAANKGHGEASKLLVTAKGASNYRAPKLKCIPLWLAAANGHDHIVSLLLENDENIETKDVGGRDTPLLIATKNNHYSTAKILIQRGAKIEARDPSGTSPLMWSLKNRNDMIMKLLIEEGANPSVVDGGAEGLLTWAANKGYEMVVQRLSTTVTSLEAKDMDGFTALSQAAIQGHDSIVKYLLQKGANTESRDEYTGRTALSWAVRAFDTVVIQTLLGQGAHLEARDGFGRTPLSWAAEEGSAAVVQLLIDRGANVESDDASGRTPLSWAAGSGNAEVVELLCGHGADPASQDYDLGRTPQSWAALNKHEATAALLLGQVKSGSSLRSMELELLQATKDDDVPSLRRILSIAHATGYLGETALRACLIESVTRGNIDTTQCLFDFSMSSPRVVHSALLRVIKTNYDKILLMMLDYGASLGLRYADGNTLLMTAALKGYQNSVKMTCSIKYSALVARLTIVIVWAELRFIGLALLGNIEWSMSALHFAVTYAWNDIVLLLLRNGADPNISNDEGNTPLHFAGMFGLMEIAQTLLLSGAKVTEQNVDGSTPLHIAARAGQANVVEILLQELPLPLLRKLEGLKDRHGQTALSLATSNGHEAVVDLLSYGGIGISSKFTTPSTFGSITPSTFGSITKELSRSVSGYNYEDSE
ncbi:uncharacterized protein KD926_007838 [Aspergillus affinis]|uniref:uncharacterized protein n=1 Tax=Aspergillus affinis TaxID=1070780 RepID=UPI0022FE9F04|nr:uncharacterized protein KD926_007838 [Aspergillus affinis]KAI9040622.1 hypothetical protein KD926_007838 [Aspergillus affinis]